MKRILLMLLAAATLAFAGCDRFGHKENPANEGQTRRIVCVSKQINEIIYALGVQKYLVGVDETSVYPPEIKQLPTVGYHRMLSAEGIISLKPTEVFHDGNVGPPAVLEQLKKVGVPIREFSSVPDIDSTKDLIRQLAKEFDVTAKGEELCAQLDAGMKHADSVVATYTTHPKVLLVHFGKAANQYFIVGTKGFPNFMITEAGGINAADTSNFKMLSSEVIVKEQPDVILATDFGFDQQGGSVEKFMGLPGIALTPAGKNHHIYRVNEHDIFYTGPRTGQVVEDLAKLIHQ